MGSTAKLHTVFIYSFSTHHHYYINTVGDVDWVCLAPDRKVWKAPLNMVFRLCKRQVSAWLMEQQLPVHLEKDFCDFESCSEENL